MDAISTKNDREIETGLEVGEETILIPPVILPDPLRLPSLKNVGASSVAAISTSTLSPAVLRKKQSVSSMNGDLIFPLGTLDKKPYSFSEEVEQIQSLSNSIFIFIPFFY